MSNKIEISIDLIIHATEDLSKFFAAFEELFTIKQDIFTIQYLTGHFDNPITLLNAKLSKKDTREFIEKFNSKLPKKQIRQLIAEIEQRVHNSALHVRLDKQEFVQGKLSLDEKNAIKLKIYTPIYSKKNTVKIYSELLNLSN